MHMRYDMFSLDKKRATKTDEGFLVDTPILTRAGVFDYVENGKVIRELRHPDDVFKADSLKSMRGKPIVHTHRVGTVTPQNAKGNSIGTIMTEGRMDGDNVIADVVVHDPSPIESGDKELSMAYSCVLVEEPGEWNGQRYDRKQTNIKYNNVAIVKKGRAGVSRFNLDAAQLLDGEKGDEMTPEELKARNQALEEGNAKLKAERDKAQAKADSLETDQKKFNSAKIKQDALDEAMQIVELVNHAKALKLDASAKESVIDLQKKIIVAVKGDGISLKDKSGDYISAAYDMVRADIAQTEQNVAKQRADALSNKEDGASDFVPMAGL